MPSSDLHTSSGLHTSGDPPPLPPRSIGEHTITFQVGCEDSHSGRSLDVHWTLVGRYSGHYSGRFENGTRGTISHVCV